MLLLAGGVVAALLVHQAWDPGEAGDDGATPLGPIGHRAGDEGFWSESAPAAVEDLTRLGPIGRRMTGDPGGIAPPAGARRQDAAREFVAEHFVYQQAGYVFPGDRAALERHYRGMLTQGGYALAGERKTKTGERVLVFVRDGGSVVLVLAENARQADTVLIRLTVARPIRADHVP